MPRPYQPETISMAYPERNLISVHKTIYSLKINSFGHLMQTFIVAC